MKKVHTISINSEEEEEELDIPQIIEDFPAFSFWLRNQSDKNIYALKYWEKTIFKKLMAGHKMTLENYYEFLAEKEESKQELMKVQEVDRFNYSLFIGKTITHYGLKKKVISYRDADSYIHLFFETGDLLILKEKAIGALKNAN